MGGECDWEGMGTREGPMKTLGLARGKTRRGCKLDKLNFFWGELIGEILKFGKNPPLLPISSFKSQHAMQEPLSHS